MGNYFDDGIKLTKATRLGAPAGSEYSIINKNGIEYFSDGSSPTEKCFFEVTIKTKDRNLWQGETDIDRLPAVEIEESLPLEIGFLINITYLYETSFNKLTNVLGYNIITFEGDTSGNSYFCKVSLADVKMVEGGADGFGAYECTLNCEALEGKSYAEMPRLRY